MVQFFSWFAFFTMWSFATPALTSSVYDAANPVDGVLGYEALNAAYNEAANSVSSAMGFYGLSSMVFALLLAFYTSKWQINRKWVHGVSLALGGLGFLLMLTLTPVNAHLLKWCFALIGLAWGSILSMPYAMLSSSVPPKKMGVYMGIFNMFIVLPQIIAALGGINWLNDSFFGGDVIQTMAIAGLSLVLAGILTYFVSHRVS
jgi:maltose/moltooligosaccharide transporter